MNLMEEYCLKKTGKTVEEFTNDVLIYRTKGLDEIAKKLAKAIASNTHISLVGDYDNDGIFSLCILYSLCLKIASSCRVKPDISLTVPGRMTDGYGLGESILNRLEPSGLIFTVDNGITANTAIKKAKIYQWP